LVKHIKIKFIVDVVEHFEVAELMDIYIHIRWNVFWR